MRPRLYVIAGRPQVERRTRPDDAMSIAALAVLGFFVFAALAVLTLLMFSLERIAG